MQVRLQSQTIPVLFLTSTSRAAGGITLCPREYAPVTAIPAGFWNVSGGRVAVAKGADWHKAN
jgi:hypothetical protein